MKMKRKAELKENENHQNESSDRNNIPPRQTIQFTKLARKTLRRSTLVP
jgi:hypothetical protein